MNNKQVLRALEIKKNPEMSIAKVRTQMKKEFDIDVPQSTMQKALTKFKNCTTVEEVESKRGRQPNTKTTKKKSSSNKSKKKYSDEVIFLGNKVLTNMTELVSQAVEKTEMVMPVSKPTVDIRKMATIVQDVEKYVTDKLKSCQMKTSIGEPIQEELEIPPTEEIKEITKPEITERQNPSQVGKTPKQPYQPHPGWTKKAKPDDPSPQLEEETNGTPNKDNMTQEQLESTVHARYGFDEDPKDIAESLGIPIEEVIKILNADIDTEIQIGPQF